MEPILSYASQEVMRGVGKSALSAANFPLAIKSGLFRAKNGLHGGLVKFGCGVILHGAFS